ncbi:hypothetical protein Esti_006641 [Eimeria stiedai]
MSAGAAALWGKLRKRAGPSPAAAADLLPSSPAFPFGHSCRHGEGPCFTCLEGAHEDLFRTSRKETAKQRLLGLVGDTSAVSRWIGGHRKRKQPQQQQQQAAAAAEEGSSRMSPLRLQFRRLLSHKKELKNQGQEKKKQQPPQAAAAQACPDAAPATTAATAAAAAKAIPLAEAVPQEQATSTEPATAAAAAGAAEALAAEAVQHEVDCKAAAAKATAAAAAPEDPASALNPLASAAASDSIIGEGDEEKRPLEEEGDPLVGGPCCLDVSTKVEDIGGGPPQALGGPPLACLEGLEASRAKKLLEAGGVADARKP